MPSRVIKSVRFSVERTWRVIGALPGTKIAYTKETLARTKFYGIGLTVVPKTNFSLSHWEILLKQLH